MAERSFWVLIETEWDTTDIPSKKEMYDKLREAGDYGIVDIVDEKDITAILLKTDN